MYACICMQRPYNGGAVDMFAPDRVSVCLDTENNRLHILKCAAFILLNTYTNVSFNKLVYTAHKTSLHPSTCWNKRQSLGSDKLYVAIYSYKTCRYREALSKGQVSTATRNILGASETRTEYQSCRLLVYVCKDETCCSKRYFSRKWHLLHYRVDIRTTFYSKQNGEYTLHIPSFILLHMLEFSASNMLTHREQKQLLLILSSWSLVKSWKSYMSLCMIKTSPGDL